MPRDGSGVASKPAGTTAVNGQTIESAKFNSVIDDIYSLENEQRPVVKGGTGAATAAGARTALGLDLYEADLSLTAAQQGQFRANIGADLLGGFRNKLINGDFPIWQRNTSFTATGYTADRWYLSLGSGAAITASRQSFSVGQTDVPGEPQYYMSLNRGTTGSAVSLLMQLIEGVRTLAGKTVTFTFYAKASSAVSIESYIRQYFGSGGSPSSNVDSATETHALTTSWQKFSYTKALASISGKTLGSNGNDALRPTFSLPTAAGAVTVDIAHVSLVEGDATAEDDPFSPRHIQQELALCQRYYAKTYPQGVNPGTASSTLGVLTGRSPASANRPFINWRFPVEMRGTPSVVPYSPNTGNNLKMYDVNVASDYDAVAEYIGRTGAMFRPNGTLGSDSLAMVHGTADAEL